MAQSHAFLLEGRCAREGRGAVAGDVARSRSWWPRPRGPGHGVGSRGGGGAQDAGSARDHEPGAVSGTAPAQAHASKSAAVRGDAGGAAGNQRDQGSHCGHGLAGAGTARRGSRGCGLFAAKAEGAAAGARRAEPDGQLSHPDGAGDRGCADRRLRGHRDGANRRSGTAGDAVASGRGVDPHQRQVGRAGGCAALCAGHAGTTGVERNRSAGQPVDVHPHQSAQLYALRAGAAGSVRSKP